MRLWNKIVTSGRLNASYSSLCFLFCWFSAEKLGETEFSTSLATKVITNAVKIKIFDGVFSTLTKGWQPNINKRTNKLLLPFIIVVYVDEDSECQSDVFINSKKNNRSPLKSNERSDHRYNQTASHKNTKTPKPHNCGP